jgi:hypothetical protein
MRDRVKEGQMWLLLIIIGWLVLSLCSCKQIEYVPYKVETKDSIYLTKFVKDSVYVEVFKGEKVFKGYEGENDTVYITETKTVYREKLLTDTMYVERVDSIQVPYPVEKDLSRWEQTCVNYGGEAIVTIVVMIIGLIIYVVKRFFS